MNSTTDFTTMKKGFTLDQAMVEAERCLLCHDAPCSKGCPADTDPGTFIRKLRMKNVTGAIRTIKSKNILGGACGVLCPTERLCEKECCACGIGRPIEIGKIQRALIEHSWQRNLKVLSTDEQTKEKIAVIGSGPAGLSCAATLAIAGYQVTIFEARPEPGGVIRYGVPAYRFDKNFFAHELADIEALGVKILCNQRIDGQGEVEQLLQTGFSAVFLATGLWGATQLHPEAETANGVFSSVEFLANARSTSHEVMRTTCEGKKVAVIGGGSVALDCAESALKLGAEDVYLVYRRSFSQMPAEEDERMEALAAGVHFLLLNQPVEFIVDDKQQLEGLKLVRTQLAGMDSSGRRAAEMIAGSEWTLPVDIAIEAIGNRAETDSPTWYPHVQVDADNLVLVDPETYQTTVEGIFAGGDIVRGPALVVQAVEDGKKAAGAIQAFLSGKESS